MMNRVINKLGFILDLLKKGEFSFVWNGIRKRIKSENMGFGFKLDLSQEWKMPRSLISLSIRSHQSNDNEYFVLDNTNNGLIDKKIGTCYVATDKDGVPCFRQWLIGSSDNKKIRSFWGESYPILKSDEGLLEGAYTVPKYRGLGIMPAATHLISEKGRDQGIQYIITFVPKNNVNSIRSIAYAGYRPYLLRIEKWRFFHKRVIFSKLSMESIELINSFTNNRFGFNSNQF